MKTIRFAPIIAVLGMLAASTCGALAAVVVGTTPIAPPSGPLSNGLTPWVITTTEIRANEAYTVPNIADSTKYKVFWMEISFNSANNDPFQHGGIFDPILWPSFTAISGVTIEITGASYIAWDGISTKAQLTATFTPQPASETFVTPNWGSQTLSQITKIEVRTQCIPEPGPLSIMAVMLLIGSGCRCRRK
jgi:hypothetical protein